MTSFLLGGLLGFGHSSFARRPGALRCHTAPGCAATTRACAVNGLSLGRLIRVLRPLWGPIQPGGATPGSGWRADAHLL